MAKNYISIDYIVNDILMMTDDDSYDKGKKAIQLRLLAMQGLKELSYDAARIVKTAELTVSGTNTITLPSDYVRYVKIGLLGGDGRVHAMGVDKRLILMDGATAAADSAFDPPIFWDYGGIGQRYGVGGGTNSNGYYRENLDSNTIEFDSDVSGTIILEYISNGLVDSSGDIETTVQVHAFLEEALKSFIYWKSIQRKRSVPMGEKQVARREWYNQKRLGRARMQSFTKDEALQATRKSFKQAPKI